MPYKYIGRTTTFRGKSLWELVGNLKNFGVGRIVVRSAFERYPEPSYMKIVKVEALPAPENPSIDNMRKVRVWVEKTFRGVRCEKLVCIESASYKPDYVLIAKHEEAQCCQREGAHQPKEVLPRTMPFPPLLRELLLREQRQNGEPEQEPQLEVVYRRERENRYRFADDQTGATKSFGVGFGEAVASKVYKDISQ